MGKLIRMFNILNQKPKIVKKRTPVNRNIDPNSLSILKATLSDQSGRVKGNPYRVIYIPTSATLADLAMAILDSFDFDSDHMYGFYDNLKDWTNSNETYTIDEEFESDGFVDKISIGVAFDTPKKKMLFLFDYGDEWRFVVQLTKEILSDGKTKLETEVVKSFGEAPLQYPDYEA